MTEYKQQEFLIQGMLRASSVSPCASFQSLKIIHGTVITMKSTHTWNSLVFHGFFKWLFIVASLLNLNFVDTLFPCPIILKLKKKIKKAERPGNCLNPGCTKSVLQIHVLITSTSSGALNLPVICEALANTAEWSHGIDWSCQAAKPNLRMGER